MNFIFRLRLNLMALKLLFEALILFKMSFLPIKGSTASSILLILNQCLELRKLLSTPSLQVSLQLLDLPGVSLQLLLEELVALFLFHLDDFAGIFDFLDLVKYQFTAILRIVLLPVRTELLISVVNKVQVTQLILVSVPDHQVLDLI